MRKHPKARLVDLFRAGKSHLVTSNVWGGWAEAASVLLERFHGAPPRAVALRSPERAEVSASVTWARPDARTRASHDNSLNATEHGAYAVASVAVGLLDGWKVTGRAHHASGADLLMLRDVDADANDFVRLEVSGIAAGTGASAVAALRRRLIEKVDQLGKGDLSRPGVAAVVGFELAIVLVSAVQEYST